MKLMINRQLELTFANARGRSLLPRRQKRLGRAQWWFGRMREVVDKAFDWQSAPLPRPEQIYLQTDNRS